MILIADSGSTKTDWRGISPDGIVNFTQQSEGINPFYNPQEEVNHQIKRALLNLTDVSSVSEVHFFGAGCSAQVSVDKISRAIAAILPDARVTVLSDLIGAGLATIGQGKGIVGILGTGSNVGYLEAGELLVNPPSNGIWFGDEGGAGYLGKQLIGAYVNEELPHDLVLRFEARYQDRRQDILGKVYQEPFPNRYLASFVPFVYEQLDHGYIQQMVRASFSSFFGKKVGQIPNCRQLPIHLIGSVAHYFESHIRLGAQAHGLEVCSITQRPIEGLIKYFSYR